MLPPQSHVAWKAGLAILHTIAGISTFLRLWVRYHGRKLWWDDYVAGLALVLVFPYAIIFWVQFHPRVPRTGRGPPQNRNRENSLPLLWMHSLFYFTLVWSSRVSLSLSLTRIFAPGTRARRWLMALTVSFVGMYFIVCLLAGILCHSGGGAWPKGKTEKLRGCKKGFGGFFISVLVSTCFDFISDIFLVTCPLVLLWRVHLPPVERRLVLISFSASILTSLAAVVVSVFWYGALDLGPDRRLLMAGAAQIQAGISLIVCNFLVNLMFFWRVCHRRANNAPEHTSTADKTTSEQSSPESQSVELSERTERDRNLTFTPISEDHRGGNNNFNLDNYFNNGIRNPQLTLTSTFESLVQRVGIENTPFRPQPTHIRTLP